MNVNLIHVRIMEPVLMGSICTLVDVLKVSMEIFVLWVSFLQWYLIHDKGERKHKASMELFVLWVSFLQWYLIHDKGERKHTISRNILCIFFGKLLGYISINGTIKHSFCNDKNNIVSCLLTNRYKWMWIWSMWE